MTPSSSPSRIRNRMWPTVVLELGVVAGLLLAYRTARLLTGHPGAVAFDNARSVLSWEHALPLPSELGVQHALLASETVTRLANVYYATVHFPLTGAFLIWLFIRSRDHYRRIRTSLAVLTGLAMVIHAAFPLAPARMLPGRGFVDTAAAYGPAVYRSPETDKLTNQFAAMPSLHFGWAVMVALGVIRVSRSRHRFWWVAHPVITLLVIVGTANHYWLDAAVAAGLIVLAEYAVATWWSSGRLDTFLVPAFEWRNLAGEWRVPSLDGAVPAGFCASRRWSRSRAPPKARSACHAVTDTAVRVPPTHVTNRRCPAHHHRINRGRRPRARARRCHRCRPAVPSAGEALRRPPASPLKPPPMG